MTTFSHCQSFLEYFCHHTPAKKRRAFSLATDCRKTLLCISAKQGFSTIYTNRYGECFFFCFFSINFLKRTERAPPLGYSKECPLRQRHYFATLIRRDCKCSAKCTRTRSPRICRRCCRIAYRCLCWR